MHITCEGKAYELFEGATPQNLWNMVSGGRDPEMAVLADCEGDIIDFQTPFTGDTDVKWIPLGSPLAHRAYQRSLIMLLAIAAKEVYGGKIEVAVKHALGKALYCEFSDGHVPLQKELDVLRYKMEEIVKEGRDITQLTVGISKAEAFLRLKGRKADADLVTQMPVKEISVSQCGTFIDYFFGPMLPDMSFLKIFHLSSYAPGFLLHVPDPGEKEIKVQEETPLFARVFLESQKWSELIGCHSLAELNDAIDGGSIIDLIAVAEALHEKKLAELADEICGQDPGIRLVCIAGPSSSGKTTFMKRLIIHLWVNGVHPVMLSLDDYFRNRDEMGGESWENLQAMDISLFEETVINLLEGKEVQLPRFNFITGKKEWYDEPVRLGENQPVLVEGLHALNPKLTYFVPGYQQMRIYLSALTQININNHNRISTSDTRLLRRMVRDVQYRGHSPEDTLSIWKSVCRGEEENIFSFQNRADRVFNSALIYELPVLKKMTRPMLERIKKGNPLYPEAQRLIHFFEPFRELSDDFVPDNSILREFIGYKKTKFSQKES